MTGRKYKNRMMTYEDRMIWMQNSPAFEAKPRSLRIYDGRARRLPSRWPFLWITLIALSALSLALWIFAHGSGSTP